ncbi:MAG: peptidase U32 family protein [Bacteroidales bacterium]
MNSLTSERHKNDIEIMAPVGSYESLMAAIKTGAKSVYFGVEKLNMRARSSVNFTLDDLRQIVEICNQHKVKSYLTANTIIFDDELEEIKKILRAAKQAGVSATIASDFGVIHYARSIGLNVHISTQVNVTNIESLKFYATFADVVVLAREMNLTQVRKIYEQIQTKQIKGPSGKLVRIEMFVHGALCMAVSGKCYLSLHEKNHSANKGSCLQMCRRSYIVSDKENGQELEIDNEYIMSPKDLKTIHFLNKLIDAGVSILKIEGRARSPEYVKTVVSCYSEAVDSIFDDSFTKMKISDWDTRLKRVFNRGFWDGYYLGQQLGEWSSEYGSQATTTKKYIAKGTNYFPNIGVAEFLIEADSLSVDDEIIITGPTTGVIETKVEEIRVNLKSVHIANKGERCSIAVAQKVRRSDKLYKIIQSKTPIKIL